MALVWTADVIASTPVLPSTGHMWFLAIPPAINDYGQLFHTHTHTHTWCPQAV